MTDTPIDLKARAHRAMVEAGFKPDFPPEVLHGQLIRGAQGIDVGDRVRVRLASVDVDKGFIDFAH